MSYIVVQDWMCSELHLSGNELLVYALIYGFCQDGESCFAGSRGYICSMLNISKPTVDKALKSLVEKELINRHEYSVNGIKNITYQIFTGGKETLPGGGKESLPNNINILSNNKLLDNNSISSILSKDNILTTADTEFELGMLKEKPKENRYSKYANLINDKTQDPEIRELLFSWLDMLLEKFKDKERPLYANVLKGKLNMLDQYDKKYWKALIEASLQRGWEGFYPINTSYSTDLVTSNKYTEQELAELRSQNEERERKGLRTKF